MKRILILFLLVLLTAGLYAQKLHELAHQNVVYYSSEQAGGFAQSWAVTQGSNGLMYFGNGAGILEFDGNNWRLLQTPNAVRTFSKEMDGVIYAAGDNNIGYIKPDRNGKMNYYSLLDSIPENKRDFVAILSIFRKDGLLFFIGFKGIYVFKENRFVKTIRPQSDFRYAFQIRNKIFVRESGIGLVGVNADTVFAIPGGEFFTEKPVYLMTESDARTVVIGTSNNGLFKTPLNHLLEEKNPRIRPEEIQTPANAFLRKNSLYHGTRLDDGSIALATTLGGVMVIRGDGSIQKIYNKQTGLKIVNTSAVFQDRQGNLWVALQNGLAKIEMADPLSFFPEETVIPGIINTTLSLNNALYVGTMEGLYLLESNPTWQQSEVMYRVSRLNSDYNSVMQLKVIRNELLASTRFNLSAVYGSRMKEISDEEFGFVAYQYKKDPDILFTSNTNGLLVYEFKNGKWNTLGLAEGITYEIRSISETSDGDLWLNAFQGKLPRLRFAGNNYLKPEIVWYGSEKGLPEGTQVNVQDDFPHLSMQAGSRFYRYNVKTDRIEPDTTFPLMCQNDSLLYNNYGFFNTGLAYAYTNRGFVRIFMQPGKKSLAEIIYPRGTPGQTYFLRADTANQILWFSASDGLYVFDLRKSDKPRPAFRTALRKIIAGKDSVVYEGVVTDTLSTTITMPFTHNALTVVFSSLFYEKQEYNEYRYMLAGLDTNWTPWSKEVKASYPFLPEGTYEFHVKSRNHYNDESPEVTFTIRILAPWYRSVWAYLLYGAIFVLMVFLLIRWNSRRLKKANLQLERTVKARTAEIENQKNEIELKNVQLQIINKELEKLSIVARETDNAIMIMDASGRFEWVNDGFIRLNQFTLEMLIRERANNILDYSKNPEIHQHFTTCVASKKAVMYESEVVRRDGSVFWAQTTLTPVLNSSGEVSRIVAIDTDISRLKEVQQEVWKQKEEIEVTKEELEKINSELEKLSIVATETDNVVMIMDRDSNYEWMNEKSLKKMYGITVDELYARKGRSLLASSYTGEIGKIWQKCLSEKKSLNYQALARKANGREFWTQTTLTPIVDADGNVVKVIGIDTDISKIKQAEEKIKQQSEELSKSFDELQKKNQLISQSIEYAEKIQKAILHNENQLRELFSESFVLLMPRDVVSGDFCWFYRQGDTSVIVAADCTGHGVPGAFMSLIGSSILNEIIRENKVLDPARILGMMNEKVISVLRQNQPGESIQEDGMDVAVCSYQSSRAQLTFAGANMPLILYNDDGIVKVHGDLFSIGGTFSTRKNVRFKNQVFSAGQFSGFFLFSDGFQDQFGGEENKKFMADTFTHLLGDIAGMPVEEQKKKLLDSFGEWKGEKGQIDDVLIIGCKFNKPSI